MTWSTPSRPDGFAVFHYDYLFDVADSEDVQAVFKRGVRLYGYQVGRARAGGGDEKPSRRRLVASPYPL